tara:strand:- start:2447 stop:3013 length:567 start_codon:yes stop_codon:yes gene_type:complete
MELFLIWIGLGLIGFIYVVYMIGDMFFSEESGIALFIFTLVLALIGGPFYAFYVFYDFYLKDSIMERDLNAKLKEDEEEEEKTIINAKKIKEDALRKYLSLLQDLKENLSLMKDDESKLNKKFFNDIKKITEYCGELNKNEIAEIDKLREVLIFARLNVLQFFENNNIKNSDKLSKTINTTLKKIKND